MARNRQSTIFIQSWKWPAHEYQPDWEKLWMFYKWPLSVQGNLIPVLNTVYWKSDNVQIAFKYTRFKSFLELIYFVNQIGINAELVSGLLSLVTYVGTYWTRMTITCVWWFHGKQKRHNVLLCKHLCIPINQFCSEVILSCSHMSNSMNCYHITLRSSNFWVTWNALIDVNITLIVRW